jgi:hypothetical protein
MESARSAGRDQRRRRGSASSSSTVRRRLAGAIATGAIGLLLAGCGSTDESVDLGVGTDDSVAVAEVEPLDESALDEVEVPEHGPSYVATAIGTEISADDRTGGEVPVYAEAGDDEPSETIANPVDGTGQAVAPVVFLVEGDYDPNADWIEVNLPVRPNGSTGWVRAEDVEVTTHDFRIEVHLAEHRLVVLEGDDEVLDVPAGVGTSQTPTPGGVFYTRSLIRSTNPAYGPYAYGLSGFSEVHESFGNGPGDLGIHGTSDPATVGSDVSNGCIRIANEHITELAELLPLGVPVEIIA